VAALDARWLPLLGWQAAALKRAPRSGWIGWPRVLHFQRLRLVANNARFLVLRRVRLPIWPRAYRRRTCGTGRGIGRSFDSPSAGREKG
jgi:hypothetical protein